MPTLCMASENVLALRASTLSSLVKAGKATAPPPRKVEPATKEPKAIMGAIKMVGSSKLSMKCSAKKIK